MADEEILTVLIVDPDKVVYEGRAKRVFAPGKIAELALLPQHTPLYSELTTGTVTIEEENGSVKEQKIESGVVRIKNNDVKILIGF